MQREKYHILLMVLVVALVGAHALPADTIGNPVVPGPMFDGGTGQLFVYEGFFPTAGETVTSWSFYSDNNAQNDCSTGAASYTCFPGDSITPVLLTETSPGEFQITGIGTTRPNDLDGAQTYDFGLVSGTAEVGANTTFGFKSGGPLDTGDLDFGVVDFSAGSTGESFISVGERTQLILGDSYSGIDTDRSYSVSFNASPVPEPAAVTLMVTGVLLMSLGRLRRKKRDGNN